GVHLSTRSALRWPPAPWRRSAPPDRVASPVSGSSSIPCGTQCTGIPSGPSPRCAPWATPTSTCSGPSATSGAPPNRSVPPSIDGTVPYDVCVARTDPTVVRLQLHVGNMAMGGGDPLAYLQRYRDRYWSFHLKDVVADRSHDTELGTGTLDFRRLLAAVPDID